MSNVSSRIFLTWWKSNTFRQCDPKSVRVRKTMNYKIIISRFNLKILAIKSVLNFHTPKSGF